MADLYSHERLDAAIEQLKRTALRTSGLWAADLQARMRSQAGWSDRNGPSLTGKNARQSLEAEAGIMENGDIQIVARSDRASLTPWRNYANAPVAVFLELGTRYMHRYPVIHDTVQASAPDLIRQLRAAFDALE